MINIFYRSFLILALFFSTTLFAQNINTPRLSPAASVSHEVGLSKIKISYSSPGVNERNIYGVLVPYGIIWRAGANENTTISLSDAAKINGQLIPAGTYGFHIIPSEDEWILIFNKEFKNWGSFFYDQSQDQLRLSVKPINAQHQERLVYGFENYSQNSLDVYMHWEKKKISFTVEFDVHRIAIENFKQQLKGIAGFGWQGPLQAANYCLQNNIELEQGLKWAEQSINSQRNINNLTTKAFFLQSLGKNEELEVFAVEIEEFIGSANEFQVNNYGYILLNLGKIDKAIEIFEMNVEKYPNSWNALDSLAEALAKNGNKKEAIEYYQKALELAPLNQKERIMEIIEGLK